MRLQYPMHQGRGARSRAVSARDSKRNSKPRARPFRPPFAMLKAGDRGGTAMRIGIIGAGNIGGALTRRLTALGHEVRVANSRGPETLLDLARETGATPVSVRDAADGADVVVITIPLKNVPALPAGVLDRAKPDAAVIDT